MSKTYFNEKMTTAFLTLQKVFEELDIDAYLIGAQARDVWFFPKKAARFTRDIDWIIANSNENVFNELKAILIQREGFSSTPNPLKIKSPEGIEVDLIPFDYPETPHFMGLHEIFERGTEGVPFDDGKIYQVATLPAIVLLKLIAWDNRPENRVKDIVDIAYILQNSDVHSDDFYDNHIDLLDIFDLDSESDFIRSRVIGRKISQIIADSLYLNYHIVKILENQITNAEKSKIIDIIVAQTENTENHALTQLKELLIGLDET